MLCLFIIIDIGQRYYNTWQTPLERVGTSKIQLYNSYR